MKTFMKNSAIVAAIVLFFAMISAVLAPVIMKEAPVSSDVSIVAFAEGEEEEPAEEAQDNSVTVAKAWAAGIAIAIVAAFGVASMGLSIFKSVDSIARQPEADNKIRTTMLLGLVFLETAIIFTLVVAILIIFVL